MYPALTGGGDAAAWMEKKGVLYEVAGREKGRKKGRRQSRTWGEEGLRRAGMAVTASGGTSCAKGERGDNPLFQSRFNRRGAFPTITWKKRGEDAFTDKKYYLFFHGEKKRGRGEGEGSFPGGRRKGKKCAS